MKKYVIMREDGLYARAIYKNLFTRNVEKAVIFDTKKDAELELLIGYGEKVVAVECTVEILKEKSDVDSKTEVDSSGA